MISQPLNFRYDFMFIFDNFLMVIFQMSTLALEQDVFILQKDCDQKEATIKELLDLVKCSDEASSKVSTVYVLFSFFLA